MAWEHGCIDIGQYTAAGDYNDAVDQYLIVRITTGQTIAITTAATLNSIGILQDRPSSGMAANVRVWGISKARVTTTAHSAITAGTKIGASTVGAGSVGPSTLVTRYVLGRSLDTLAANTTGIITILITHEGAGSSGAGAGA